MNLTDALIKKFAQSVARFALEEIPSHYERMPEYRFEVDSVQVKRKKGQVAQWKRDAVHFRKG